MKLKKVRGKEVTGFINFSCYPFRFSGVTREDLADVTTTISDIHDILLNMLDKNTILMGHSLESDLNALNVSL